jgi:fructokinase
MSDILKDPNLSLQDGNGSTSNEASRRVLVVGEVLWDVYGKSKRLGGAPLSFAAHANRLGCDPRLISAVGTDKLGKCTTMKIASLGLDTSFVQRTPRFSTGTAQVYLGPGERTRFVIARPAAYDSVTISDEHLNLLQGWNPGWLYYGTLFAARAEGKAVLDRLFQTLPSAWKFYDLNLRPGYDSSALVLDLLTRADVVKLNEEELDAVRQFTGLPRGSESFCREAAARYGWKAAALTLGAQGCAMLVGDEYIEAPGYAVAVADPVGAGDAFAAAFLHGIGSRWPVGKIAQFANRLGALVASRHGAIPDWTLEEALKF